MTGLKDYVPEQGFRLRAWCLGVRIAEVKMPLSQECKLTAARSPCQWHENESTISVSRQGRTQPARTIETLDTQRAVSHQADLRLWPAALSVRIIGRKLCYTRNGAMVVLLGYAIC